MSQTAKTAITVVIVVAVVAGIAWFISRTPGYAPETANTPQGQSSPQDSSDAGIDRDLALLDAQLSAMNSDSTAVDRSMNDKPVEQENP